ncbi:MAG: hypothetical protein JO352_12145 [Chloroflexi bacterium]|nr:hypothetical protein [Chloroflexota bacterium]
MARLTCLGMLASATSIFMVSLPTRYDTLVNTFQNLTPAEEEVLLRLPQIVDAHVILGVEMTVTAAFLAVASIILWQRSDDWLALHVAAALAGFVVWVIPALQSLAETPSPWQLPARLAQALGMSSTVAFLYVFPDGRFVPSWTRALMLPLGLSTLAWLLAPNSMFDLSNPFRLSLPSFVYLMGWWASGLAAQSYRYARVATPVQRQQMLAILAAAVVGIALYVVLCICQLVLAMFQDALWAADLLDLLGVPLFLLTILAIPIAFAIAIFRFRLWDIELLVNRALVYGALTAIVAGLYPTTLGFFQRLFVAVTGDHSEAAVVVSTLLMASLLTPLKTWLQSVVDSYMRQSVDHVAALQAFARHMQDVVDVLDVEAITREALEQAVSALHATGGAVYLRRDRHFQPTYVSGEWSQIEGIANWLESNGFRYGWMVLGPPRDGIEYTAQQQQMFADTVALVARVLGVADRLRVSSQPQSSPRSLA